MTIPPKEHFNKQHIYKKKEYYEKNKIFIVNTIIF